MKALLSDGLWPEIGRRASGHTRLRCAISYVTADHLDFGPGDLLVCDASDAAIRGGLTSASLLRRLLDAGAQVYSFPGLHSKIAVVDSFALVGSANLSANAGVHTCEAVLLTDEPQVVALALAFIEKVRVRALRVTPAVARRLQLLPVTRRRRIPRRREDKITVGESRVWFVSTHPLSGRIIDSEAAFEAAGIEQARKHARRGYRIDWMRWAGKSTFRMQAKAGDVVIQAFTHRTGRRQFTEVYAPSPIIHRQDEASWTRFYLEYPPDDGYYGWRDVESDFKALGVRISRNSTRELTGKALGILDMLK